MASEYKVTVDDAATRWYSASTGRRHRENGPAVEWSIGTKEYYLDGKRHREDGYAVEWLESGEYWINGEHQTKDQFDAYHAQKSANDSGVMTYTVKVDEIGTIRWSFNGQQHRLDGPAVEFKNGIKMWKQHDLLHRDDGPAVIFEDGSVEYWINGNQMNEDVYNNRNNPKKSSTNTNKEFIEWFDPMGKCWRPGYFVDSTRDGKRNIIECAEGTVVLLDNVDGNIRRRVASQ